jgi:hypothetical protein
VDFLFSVKHFHAANVESRPFRPRGAERQVLIAVALSGGPIREIRG